MRIVNCVPTTTVLVLSLFFLACNKSTDQPREPEDRKYEGIIYGISRNSELFAFDLETEKLLWRKSGFLGGLSHNFIFHDTTIYLNDAMRIRAVDAVTGITKWQQYATEGFTGNGHHLYCRPVVSGNFVFAVMSGRGHQSELCCFDRRTGRELWRKLLGPSYDPGYWYTTPVVAKDKVIALGRAWQSPVNIIMCFDQTTGAEIWQNTTIPNRLCSHPFTPDSVQVIFPAIWGGDGLYSLDINTGKLLWQHQAIAVSDAQPIPYQNDNLILFSMGHDVAARFDLATKTITKQVKADFRHCTSWTDQVYGVDYNDRMKAYDLSTGTLKWERDIPSKPIRDSIDYYNSTAGSWSFTSAPTADGEIVYYYETIVIWPTVYLNSLYLHDPKTGTVLKEIKMPLDPTALLGRNLLLVKDGKIFAPSVTRGY
jgi:outer membrane protein assembly factor BamB